MLTLTFFLSNYGLGFLIMKIVKSRYRNKKKDDLLKDSLILFFSFGKINRIWFYALKEKMMCNLV